MNTHRCARKPLYGAGVDITQRVYLRMITPDERESLAAGHDAPRHFEETISVRLPASVRDEAIWQYHLNGKRGVVRLCADESLLYVPETEYLLRTNWDTTQSLLARYNPVTEALLSMEYADNIEVFRIETDGRVTILSTHLSRGLYQLQRK